MATKKGSEMCFHLLCVMEGGRREDIGASMLHVCMQKENEEEEATCCFISQSSNV